jgi:hypothetical protein
VPLFYRAHGHRGIAQRSVPFQAKNRGRRRVPVTVRLGFSILSLSTRMWIVAGTRFDIDLESPDQKN